MYLSVLPQNRLFIICSSLLENKNLSIFATTFKGASHFIILPLVIMRHPNERRISIYWLHKLSNQEFTYTINVICESIGRLIEQEAFLIDLYNELTEHNNALKSASNNNRKSELTKQIGEWHKQRKRLITEVVTTSRIASKTSLDDKMANSGEIALNWVTSIDKRPYDLGITALGTVTDAMLANIETNSHIRDAIKHLELDANFADIKVLNKKIFDAQIRRGVELSKNAYNKNLKEIRQKTYECLKSFIFNLSWRLFSEHDENLLKINNVIHYHLSQVRSPLAKREAERKRREG